MGSIPGGVIEIFLDIMLPGAPWLWARPSLQQIRLLVLSPGRKWRAVRRAKILVTLMCRLSRKPENLNLLELLGSVQACTGTAVPFIILNVVSHHSV